MRLVLMEVVFLESKEVAQDAYDYVSSFFVYDRAYLFLDHLACVLFFLTVLLWCCVAFLYKSS